MSESTVKLVTLAEVKIRLGIAGSRLREALDALKELTTDDAFRPGLEDHEFMNLQDNYERVLRASKYVDEVFKDKDVAVRRAGKRVKHA